MSRILVVDDKEMMRDSVATTLSRKGHTVISATGGPDALERIRKKMPDAVVTDLQMPDMDGLELFREIRRIDEELPVVFMTAYGTVETAVTAMREGAYDYITKPFTGEELLVAVERAIEHRRLLRENEVLRAGGTRSAGGPPVGGREHEMVGSSPAMTSLTERLGRIADSHGTVLISGESGSGKEVAARWIHEHSPRAGEAFLAINCAALSTSLLESELFGHERGAFTGADRLRKGRFELADGGTLLLDEISEVSPSTQAKLLRVLQEQSFERVGSSQSMNVDVRVIATTNRDLESEVAKGNFRQDLYYRLNVLPVGMPALRTHAEDIAELAAHFLEKLGRREGRPAKRFTDEAMAILTSYAWPGNVRELQNICERAAVLTPGESIEASLIRPWIGGSEAPVGVDGRATSMLEMKPDGSAATMSAAGLICDGRTRLEDIEREAIVATLQQHNGHRVKSAKALGIGVRTLGLKLKKWKQQQLVDASL